MDSEKYKCSSCELHRDQVKILISLQKNVFLCDQCVNLCVEAVHEDSTGKGLVTMPIAERDRLQGIDSKYKSAMVWIESIKRSVTEAEIIFNEQEV